VLILLVIAMFGHLEMEMFVNSFIFLLILQQELVPFQKFAAHEDYILKCLISPDVQ